MLNMVNCLLLFEVNFWSLFVNLKLLKLFKYLYKFARTILNTLNISGDTFLENWIYSEFFKILIIELANNNLLHD
jgi:hypothetical protein